MIVLITLAFLLMAAAIILVNQLPDDNAWQVTADTTAAPVQQSGGFSCSASEAQQLYPFADGVAKVTANRIAYLDVHGTENFAVDIDFTAPFVVIQDRFLLAADRDGHAYVMITPDGESYRGSLNGSINGAAVSPDGMAALIQDQTDSTGLVTVLAALTGQKLYDCYFPESGYVLSVSFTGDGAFFDVALANTNASVIHPKLKRYNIAGEQQALRQPDLDSLYPLITYDPEGHPVICGSSQIAAISYDQEDLLWQRQYNQIQSVAASGDALLVLAANQTGGAISLYRIEADGSSSDGLVIGDSATFPAVSGHLTAIGSGTRLLLVDCRNDQIILDQTMADEIIRVGFAGSRSLTVVTRTGVYSLPVSAQ
ncbi:MAG: DUF5711 family protein [Clostridiaceae bacterium]|nr:DUF5711 family protein [Clostridiaceae bacterium]